MIFGRQQSERVKDLCMKRCGRTEDLTTADVAKLFPEITQKTISNDARKSLPVAGKSGQKLLFTWKEILLYGIARGKWSIQ